MSILERAVLLLVLALTAWGVWHVAGELHLANERRMDRLCGYVR